VEQESKAKTAKKGKNLNAFAALVEEDEEEEEEAMPGAVQAGEAEGQAAVPEEASLKRKLVEQPKVEAEFAHQDRKRTKKGGQAIQAEEQEEEYPVEHLVACSDCVAHMVCKVVQMQEVDDAHWLTTAEIKRAFVRRNYWSGKTFIPQTQDTPPYLTFLGSQKFAYVTADPKVEAQ